MLNNLTNNHQKTPQSGALVNLTSLLTDWIDNLNQNISKMKKFVKNQIKRTWTCRELNSVDLGYQCQIKYNTEIC